MTSSNVEPLTELELLEVAEKIPVDAWRKLGLWLGFKEAVLTKYERENWFSGAASTGTFKMLCDWVKRIPEEEQRPTLTRALQRCDLEILAKEVLKGTCTGLFGPDIAPIRNRLISYAKTKLLRVPLIPWAKANYIQVDAIFISVKLILHISGPDIPIRCPLDSYNDILADDFSEEACDLSANRFIVRGRAGSGKTTLLVKLLSDWCKEVPGSLLAPFKLVFLLPMRKLNFGSNLGESIVQHCLPRDAGITAESIERICHEQPKDVFILLDGYDEFQGKGLEGEEPGSVVAMLRCESFLDVHVLITTRPGRLDDFQEFGDFRHFEVSGFTRDHVHEYIEKTFTGKRQQVGHNLYAYLDGNNLLSEVSSVPLLLCAFCQVAKWTDGVDFGKLSTYSALFMRLVRCFFEHELAKPKVAKDPNSSPTDLRIAEITIMSEEYLFDQLGKIAMLGFFREKESELLFSEEDFTRCSASGKDVIEQGCIAGLLTRDDDVSVAPWEYESSIRNISFVLKTVQEMFAGRYFGRLVELGEVELFRAYLTSVSSVQRISDLANVFMFGCGQSIDVAREIIVHVVNVIVEEDLDAIDAFWNGELPIQECRRVQQLLELCLNLNYESQSEGRLNVYLQPLFRHIRLFSPAQRTARTLGYLLQYSDPHRISETPTDNNRRRSSGNIHLRTQNGGRKSLPDMGGDQRGNNVGVDAVDGSGRKHGSPQKETRGCSARQDVPLGKVDTSADDQLHIKTLEVVHVNKMFGDQFRQLRDFLPTVKKDFFRNVNNLALHESRRWASVRKQLTCNQPDEFNDIDHLSDSQFVAYLPVREELKTWQVNEIFLDAVFNGLMLCSVETLVITGISQNCQKWRDLFLAMEAEEWTKLIKLDISRNNLPASHMNSLAKALYNKPHLQHLDVSGNVIKKSFVSILPELPCLKRIYLNSEQMTPETLSEFGGRLRGFPKLELIDLNHNPLDDTAAAEIGDNLKCCSNLKRLRLDVSGVSDGGISRLVGKIKYVPSLTHLGLYKHRNADELMRSMTSTLNKLKHLVSLSLTGRPNYDFPGDSLAVGLSTAQSFARVITTQEHMQILELFNIRLSAIGLTTLLESLQNVTKLEEFRYAENCLPEDDEVAEACKKGQYPFLKLY